MTHKRRAIVNAIETQIGNFPGLNTRSSDFYPIEEGLLPMCTILVDSEEITEDSVDGRQYRALAVDVEITVQGGETVPQIIDDYCEAVEIQVMADETLGGLCIFNKLVTTEINYNAEADKRHANALLSYLVQYETTRTNPSA